MREPIDAYPLSWPIGWKRTEPHRRKSSRYKVTFARARDEVLHSLQLMGVRDYNVIISSNVPLRRDGLPLANMREPDDVGIAVYWSNHKQERRVIACDKWRTVRENLRAVNLALEALRMLERTGSSEILNRAFTGFAALPPASAAEEDWRAVLKLRGMAVTSADIEESYRELAKEAHPDSGGDHDAMVRLNQARDAALKFLGAR
jgi:hypothetical protein